MKKQSGKTYTSSIEEDCIYLRQCLETEARDSFDFVFDDQEIYDEKHGSAWEDYGHSKVVGCGLMKYEFESPVELKSMLDKLWKDKFSEDFIRSFLAVACKWGNISGKDLDGEIVRQEELNIPSHIYNF